MDGSVDEDEMPSWKMAVDTRYIYIYISISFLFYNIDT